MEPDQALASLQVLTGMKKRKATDDDDTDCAHLTGNTMDETSGNEAAMAAIAAAGSTATTTNGTTTADSKPPPHKAPRKEGPVAITPSKPLPVPDESVWRETVLSHIPRCDAAEGLQETSYFRNKVPTASSGSSSGRTHCLRRLLQEIASLEEDLPHNPAIWLRFDEETPQFLRALLTAPTQTPYSLGLFCFDIYVPDSYPLVPPKMQLLTTGRGTVRFSPNLYADGKVCLSLLNTWNGPRWNPNHSTLLQCLVSLQGLILGVEHPYYLEPGHGGWEGKISEAPTSTANTPTVAASAKAAIASMMAASTDSASAKTSAGTAASAAVASAAATAAVASAAAVPAPGVATTVNASTVPYHVQQFEDRIRLGTARFAMLDMIQSVQNNSSSSNYKYLRAFGDIITAHFYHCQERVIQETLMWAKTMKLAAQRRHIKQVTKDLQQALAKLQPLPLLPGSGAAKGAASNIKGIKKDSDKNGESNMSQGESAVAKKKAAMEEAAAQKDYITAGRLQTEILHADLFGSVEAKVTAKRQEMELAASKGDYITAGQLQVTVQHLESNKKLLQNLEKRMLDSAAKMDFVRAGRFQEQYKILLSSEGDSLSSSKAAAQSMAASGGGAAAGGAAGMGPTVYSMPSPFSFGGPPPGYPFHQSAKASAAALNAIGGMGGADYNDDDDYEYGDY